MNLIKAIILSAICFTGLVNAAEDGYGKFIKLDTTQPDETLPITPLACKYFVQQAVVVTTMYLDGANEPDRVKWLAGHVLPAIGNDDHYAGNALAVRFNHNIVKILAEPEVKKDIGYGYTYPQSVQRQMPKMCANMVGTTTTHFRRVFEKKS